MQPGTDGLREEHVARDDRLLGDGGPAGEPEFRAQGALVHLRVLGEARLLGVLREVSTRLPLVFALHPRTRGNIDRFGLTDLIDPTRMALLPPQGYLEMVGLMADAAMVLTDSGGLQEETTALGVPCLTLRENTERPITIDQGTNTLVGRDRDAILRGVDDILAGRGKHGRVPEYWDGRAAERIAADLWQWLRPKAAP